MIYDISIIGLGEIGLAVALYINNIHKFSVIGYDTDIKKMKVANAVEVKTSEDFPNSEIYIICVSDNPVNNIFNVCKQIKKINNNALVSIESTIKVGTCRSIKSFLNINNIVCCPHRYWEEDTLNHGVNQIRVLGALTKSVLNKGFDFYHNLGIPVYPVIPIEIAEMSKISENAYRYVQIAFAEELKMICDENDLDFEMVRNVCNTKWNIDILEARDGIKGKCLSKDTKYLLELTKYGNILKGAIEADWIYRSLIK